MVYLHTLLLRNVIFILSTTILPGDPCCICLLEMLMLKQYIRYVRIGTQLPLLDNLWIHVPTKHGEILASLKSTATSFEKAIVATPTILKLTLYTNSSLGHLLWGLGEWSCIAIESVHADRIILWHEQCGYPSCTLHRGIYWIQILWLFGWCCHQWCQIRSKLYWEIKPILTLDGLTAGASGLRPI